MVRRHLRGEQGMDRRDGRRVGQGAAPARRPHGVRPRVHRGLEDRSRKASRSTSSCASDSPCAPTRWRCSPSSLTSSSHRRSPALRGRTGPSAECCRCMPRTPACTGIGARRRRPRAERRPRRAESGRGHQTGVNVDPSARAPQQSPSPEDAPSGLPAPDEPQHRVARCPVAPRSRRIGRAPQRR